MAMAASHFYIYGQMKMPDPMAVTVETVVTLFS